MNELIALPKIAQWQKLKMLVLDSVSSQMTKRVYNMALDEFYNWFQQAPRPGFTKATVSGWRVSLEARGLGSSSIIIRMSAILAAEAADNGLLAPELAQGISRVKSAKSTGIRVRSWLSQRQAQALLRAPDISTVRGLRDRSILAVLLGCGLRRSEVAALTLAQFAERQGRQAALNLVRILKGESTQPFRFKALGQLCSIGGYQAVAEILGFRISGFVAWLLWRGVYLFKLLTLSRRLKVALDWAWDLMFPRDLSFLNTEATKAFTHSYYRPVIFLGEIALLENRPHETSIRARTAVRLRQVGSALFSEISGTFAPFREVLSKAVSRRSGNFWNLLPQAGSVLERVPPTTCGISAVAGEWSRAPSPSPTGQLRAVRPPLPPPAALRPKEIEQTETVNSHFPFIG
jgi:CRP-like cAMP-binding protein